MSGTGSLQRRSKEISGYKDILMSSCSGGRRASAIAANRQGEAERERDDIAEPREQASSAGGGAGKSASIDPRRAPRQRRASTSPRASITALIPVGVERITGRPSSAARSRAWARCCGGPQRPNQASFDGIEDEVGAVGAVDDLAREDDLVADLQARPCPSRREASIVRGPGPRLEVDVARRQPRQADRREQRAHRQIFAVGHEMRLVVAAEHARRAASSANTLLVVADDRGPSFATQREGRRSAGCRRGAAIATRARDVGIAVERCARRRRWILEAARSPRLRARTDRRGRGGPRSRQAGEALAATSSKPLAPFVLLADVGLDDADRRAVGGPLWDRPVGDGHAAQSEDRPRAALPAAGASALRRQPQRAAGQHDRAATGRRCRSSALTLSATACRPAPRRPGSRRSR